MSSPLRSILAEFGFEVDHHALEKGEHHVQGFIKTIEHVGSIVAEAFIFREVVEFVEKIVETGVELEHLSVKTGVATDELQGLEFAARLSGVGAETLDVALGRLGKSLVAAKDGSKESAAAFAAAGVSVKDSEGHVKSAAEVLPELADAFIKIQNPSERAALAIKLFGRGGVALVPLLAKGSEGIHELTEEAKALGGGLSEDAVHGAVAMHEATARLDFAMLGLKGTLAEEIFPALADFITQAAHIIKDVRDWAKHTKIIEAVTAGFATKGVLVLVKHLGGLGGILRTVIGLLARTILPMLVLEDLFVFFAGGKSAIGEILERTFGKGTSQKVRDFVKLVGDKLRELFDKFKGFVKAKDLIRDVAIALGILAAFKVGGLAVEMAKAASALGLLKGPALALSAAILGIVAAWDQLNKLTAETEGLGLGGLLEEMAHQGTLDPAKALKTFQDRKARERAGLPAETAPGTAEGAPVRGDGYDPNPGFFKRLLGAGSEGKKVAAQLDEARKKSPNQVLSFDATAPASAYAPVPASTVDSHDRINVGAPVVNVTVPPGTPAAVARDVGNAAGKGVQRAAMDLSAAQAATVTTGG